MSQLASNLIVNYLPKEFTDDILAKLFAPYGEIESARIIRDKQTNDTKGYGFVKYTSGESAMKAIRALQGFEILGKRLKLSYSHHNKAPIPLNMVEVLSQQQQFQHQMISPQHRAQSPQPNLMPPLSPSHQPIIFVVQQPISPQSMSPQPIPLSPQMHFHRPISPSKNQQTDNDDFTLPSPSHISPGMSPSHMSLLLPQHMQMLNEFSLALQAAAKTEVTPPQAASQYGNVSMIPLSTLSALNALNL